MIARIAIVGALAACSTARAMTLGASFDSGKIRQGKASPCERAVQGARRSDKSLLAPPPTLPAGHKRGGELGMRASHQRALFPSFLGVTEVGQPRRSRLCRSRLPGAAHGERTTFFLGQALLQPNHISTTTSACDEEQQINTTPSFSLVLSHSSSRRRRRSPPLALPFPAGTRLGVRACVRAVPGVRTLCIRSAVRPFKFLVTPKGAKSNPNLLCVFPILVSLPANVFPPSLRARRALFNTASYPAPLSLPSLELARSPARPPWLLPEEATPPRADRFLPSSSPWRSTPVSLLPKSACSC